MTSENLPALAYKLRQDVLKLIDRGKTGHIGGDYSMMEILVTLYFREMNVFPDDPENEGRDYFILSKGHSVESYYAVLCEKGFLDLQDLLERYAQFKSPYIGHPNNKLPGIEMNSGSLGHGLPVAVGIAKGLKMDKKANRVYVVMGDGELGEGSVYEGAMAASQYGLDNLLAVIDRNGLQISGSTEEVMHQDHLRERFEAFGWTVFEANGHDIDALYAAMEQAKSVKGRPTLIIADTVKSKGIPFAENVASWHHHLPTEEEYQKIMDALQKKEAQLRADASCSLKGGN